MMRALGPGSVSSLLKMILDVVYVALWIGVGGAATLVALAALLLSFNPDLLSHITLTAAGEEVVGRRGPFLFVGLISVGLYIAGVLVIVDRLRRIFSTLTAGDPFHPDNVTRLRIVGLMLAMLEIGRYAVWTAGAWLFPGVNDVKPEFSLTAWFSVLVVFVLAEVFREGARLRREAELTI